MNRSNSYFELKSPEEYKQLSVALTLANAKLEDMYMMKTHSDFQILQNRIQEQLNTTEALRQIKESELTLNPKVVSYLFNGPALAQQQAQQNLQQIQNPAPVGIPAIAPIEEQKADPPDGEEKGEQDVVDVEDDEIKNAEEINAGFRGKDLNAMLETLDEEVKEASRDELEDMVEEAEEKLKTKGLSDNAKVYYTNQASSASFGLQVKPRPKAEEDEDEGTNLKDLTRNRLEEMVREKLGKVKLITQSNYAKKENLITILKQNMKRDEAEEYMREVKDDWDRMNEERKQTKDLEELQRKQELKDLMPDVRDAVARKPIVKVKQKKKKKEAVLAGKGLKYKKTPKKLLMVGSAHAGNNSRKLLKMLR